MPSQHFSSDGTFTWPDGVTQADVTVLGGGAGGAGDGGYGGGGGGTSTGTLFKSSSTTSVTVGPGGAGGDSGSSGGSAGNGTDSSADSITAGGGNGISGGTGGTPGGDGTAYDSINDIGGTGGTPNGGNGGALGVAGTDGGGGSVDFDWLTGYLAFIVQPANGAGGQPLDSIKVGAYDVNNVLDTLASGNVTLSINSNPGSGTLSGTLTRPYVDGIATFNDVSINNDGTGYTLDAAGTDIDPATSDAFNIATGTLNARGMSFSAGRSRAKATTAAQAPGRERSAASSKSRLTNTIGGRTQDRSAASAKTAFNVTSQLRGSEQSYVSEQPEGVLKSFVQGIGASRSAARDTALAASVASLIGRERATSEERPAPSIISFIAAIGSSRVATRETSAPTILSFIAAIGSSREIGFCHVAACGLPSGHTNDMVTASSKLKIAFSLQARGSSRAPSVDHLPARSLPGLIGRSASAADLRGLTLVHSSTIGRSSASGRSKIGPGTSLAASNGKERSASYDKTRPGALAKAVSRSIGSTLSRGLTRVTIGANARITGLAWTRSPLYAIAKSFGSESSASLTREASRALASSLARERSAAYELPASNAAAQAFARERSAAASSAGGMILAMANGLSREASSDYFQPVIYAGLQANEQSAAVSRSFVSGLPSVHGTSEIAALSRISPPKSYIAAVGKDYSATYDRLNLTCNVSAFGRSFGTWRSLVYRDAPPALSIQAEARIMISQSARGRIRIN